MNELLSKLIADWQLLHSIELVATLLAVAYVVLALKHSIWCWPAALLSTLLFTHVMWDSALLSDALLHIYYAGMAVYGWWRWRQLQQQSGQAQPVYEWDVGEARGTFKPSRDAVFHDSGSRPRRRDRPLPRASHPPAEP